MEIVDQYFVTTLCMELVNQYFVLTLSGELVDQWFVTTLYSSESLKDFLNKRIFLLSEACTLYSIVKTARGK